MREQQYVVEPAWDAVELHRREPATPPIQGGRAGGVAQPDHLLADAAGLHELEGARLHRERPRGGRRLWRPIDDPHSDAEPRELHRGGQPGRAGAHDQHLHTVAPGLHGDLPSLVNNR